MDYNKICIVNQLGNLSFGPKFYVKPESLRGSLHKGTEVEEDIVI